MAGRRRLRGDRYRPSRARRRAARARGAAGRGLPRRDARDRSAKSGSPVSVSPGSIRVGVVGLGYWGPNLARNFDRLPGAELAWVCDGSAEVLERVAAGFPDARTTQDFAELLADPELDAVAIATPVPTHAGLAEETVGAGKHCFVE